MNEQKQQTDLPAVKNLSVEETKTMITPYAFAVEESLFGLPLASPRRRGIAITIDAIIVGLLAQQSVALLAILASATFFKAGKAKKNALRWRRTRQFLRILGMLLMVLILMSLVDGIVEKYSEKDKPADGEAVTELLDKNNVVVAGLSEEDIAKLNKLAKDAGQNIEDKQDKADKEVKAESANVTDWLKGIIENDLGFGFGWAALYFTVFTAWWGGQTPGKRLLGVRVIRLDGKPINLWDAFGRYGGYGAGFATGLLGFFQIYWDPNRQAIHDKISATVVITGDLPQPQHKTNNQENDK